MSSVGEMDIQGAIADSLSEFFERILSLQVELDDGDLLAVQEGEGFVTVMEVAGDLSGRLEIKMGNEFAVLMAASMLGGGIDDVDAEYEVPDLLGEMADFLGRKLKENFAREGIACKIVDTRIVARDDLLEFSAPLPHGSRCVFRHDGQEGWVDFRLDRPDSDDAPAVGKAPDTGSEEPAIIPHEAEKPADSQSGLPEKTVTVPDGDHEISLDLEPLEAPGDENVPQDFAGLSEEEEDLSDLMADITDTGAKAEVSAGSTVGGPQKTTAESPLREPAPSEKAPPPVEDLPERGEREFRPQNDSRESAVQNLQRLPETEPEDEESPPGGGRRGLVWLTAVTLAAVAVGGWFFMMHRQGDVLPEPQRTAIRQEEKTATAQGKHLAAGIDRRPPRETAALTAETRLDRKLGDAARLREALLGKLEEVLRLKRYFQDGIEDVRSQLAVRIQNSGIRSYRQAIVDQRIELDLRTIQRRLAAIEELRRPIGWLTHAAEAVDYGIRRARIDLSMAPYTAGADLNRLYQGLEGLTKQYALTDERLIIDGQTVEARPLNVIWQEITSPVKKVAWVQGDGSGVRGTFVNWADSAANRRIWKELCRGDFSHAAELSMISSEAAACLASDQVRDLFLGGLRELSGAAARNLVKWPGKWLVLNGLASISPAAARQLSRWRGKRLSLNGLMELSPQAAASLARWGGRDLEMVSLTVKDARTAGKILGPLKKWESGGRRLFVSPDIRKMLDRM